MAHPLSPLSPLLQSAWAHTLPRLGVVRGLAIPVPRESRPSEPSVVQTTYRVRYATEPERREVIVKLLPAGEALLKTLAGRGLDS